MKHLFPTSDARTSSLRRRPDITFLAKSQNNGFTLVAFEIPFQRWEDSMMGRIVSFQNAYVEALTPAPQDVTVFRYKPLSR